MATTLIFTTLKIVNSRQMRKYGMAYGGFLSVSFGSFLGVQPEVLYSEKGFNSTGTILGSAYEMTRSTDYIDVPIC